MSKPPPDPTQDPQPPSFEEALGQLEGLVHQLEEGQLGLDAALAKYEQGVKLLRTCHDLLQRAERRIQLLAGLDAEGNPIGTPLDDPSLSLDEKSKQRSRRRTSPTSSAPPPGPGLDDDNPAIDEGWPIS